MSIPFLFDKKPTEKTTESRARAERWENPGDRLRDKDFQPLQVKRAIENGWRNCVRHKRSFVCELNVHGH